MEPELSCVGHTVRRTTTIDAEAESNPYADHTFTEGLSSIFFLVDP